VVVTTERPVPQDTASEEAIIGAALYRPGAYDAAVEAGLTAGHFYSPANAHVWDAIAQLTERGAPVDTLTIASHLAGAGMLEEIGGRGKLLEYGAAFPSAEDRAVTHYAERITATADVRAAIAAGAELVEMGYGPWTDVTALKTSMLARLDQALEINDAGHKAVSLAQAMPAWARHAFDPTAPDPARPTGWTGIDNLTGGGLRGGQLITVGARPGSGKTVWGLQLCLHWSRGYGIPTLLVSLEMSLDELLDRVVANESGVRLDSVRAPKNAGRLNTDAMRGAAERATGWPLHILDDSAATLATIAAKARRIPGLGLIVVDYAQLLQPVKDGRRYENRQVEMADVSKGLKRLGRRLDIPVVALAQLSRETEKRPNKRPVLSDLRETGQFEQDSDLVIGLYRDENTPKPDPREKGLVEQIVLKQRNGPFPRTIKCGFDGEHARILNLAAYTGQTDLANEPDDPADRPPIEESTYPDPDEEF
jgi:replicative DNA helicase